MYTCICVCVYIKEMEFIYIYLTFPLPFRSPTDTRVASLPWLLWLRPQWTREHRYLFAIVTLFPLDKRSDAELLGPMAVLFFISGGSATLFSVVAAPVHDPSTEHWGPLSPRPRRHSPYLSDDSRPDRCGVSRCVFICISLRISDAEQLFMSLLVMSSLETCLFRPFAHV